MPSGPRRSAAEVRETTAAGRGLAVRGAARRTVVRSPARRPRSHGPERREPHDRSRRAPRRAARTGRDGRAARPRPILGGNRSAGAHPPRESQRAPEWARLRVTSRRRGTSDICEKTRKTSLWRAERRDAADPRAGGRPSPW
ncbi:hypothetical protein DEJ44_00595 [Streptomyces venezuelae]|nr:hypothetical protein DEJ44_00595 [Streptomyces venezuelae]